MIYLHNNTCNNIQTSTDQIQHSLQTLNFTEDLKTFVTMSNEKSKNLPMYLPSFSLPKVEHQKSGISIMFDNVPAYCLLLSYCLGHIKVDQRSIMNLFLTWRAIEFGYFSFIVYSKESFIFLYTWICKCLISRALFSYSLALVHSTCAIIGTFKLLSKHVCSQEFWTIWIQCLFWTNAHDPTYNGD